MTDDLRKEVLATVFGLFIILLAGIGIVSVLYILAKFLWGAV